MYLFNESFLTIKINKSLVKLNTIYYLDYILDNLFKLMIYQLHIITGTDMLYSTYIVTSFLKNTNNTPRFLIIVFFFICKGEERLERLVETRLYVWQGFIAKNPRWSPIRELATAS